jgi:hypothetical protein
MTKPTSYFDRTQKLHSMGDVNALLERRAPGVMAKVNGGSGELIEATGRTVEPNSLDLPKPSPTPAAQSTQAAVEPDALTERRAALLTWIEPVRNKDGSGYQCAGGTGYVVRKTIVDGKTTYWAWSDKKLLGYSHDIKVAREHCQLHAERP